jgi:hypothetical protein
MLEISKESVAPIYYESLRKVHKANANGLVPEIVFSLFLCDGIRRSISIEQIAAQASHTYPADFHTWVDGEQVPDLALMLLTLNEATSAQWDYVRGDWFNGWHLTKRGLRFAKDVERRKLDSRRTQPTSC